MSRRVWTWNEGPTNTDPRRCSHRWDRATKEWVKMTPDDKVRSINDARERKKQQMIRDARPPAP